MKGKQKNDNVGAALEEREDKKNEKGEGREQGSRTEEMSQS